MTLLRTERAILTFTLKAIETATLAIHKMLERLQEEFESPEGEEHRANGELCAQIGATVREYLLREATEPTETEDVALPRTMDQLPQVDENGEILPQLGDKPFWSLPPVDIPKLDEAPLLPVIAQRRGAKDAFLAGAEVSDDNDDV